MIFLDYLQIFFVFLDLGSYIHVLDINDFKFNSQIKQKFCQFKSTISTFRFNQIQNILGDQKIKYFYRCLSS